MFCRTWFLKPIFFLLFSSYPLAIDLLATGKINVKPLITQRFNIKDALEAFKLLRDPGAQSVVKVLIQYD